MDPEKLQPNIDDKVDSTQKVEMAMAQLTHSQTPVTSHTNYLSKIVIAISVFVLITIATGAYVWRDNEANNQKQKYEKQIADLSQKIKDLEEEQSDSSSNSTDTTDIESQNKKKTSAAQSNARNTQTIAEGYYADMNRYPSITNDFVTGTEYFKIPSNINVVPESDSALNANNGANTVTWACMTSCDNPRGGRVKYWDFTNNRVSTNILYAGSATSTSTFVSPKS